MTSRHRLEKKLSHNVDITGIVVALAFLVGIGLFAGGQDNHSVSEDRQSPSASLQNAPTATMDKRETLQPPNDDLDLSDTSRKLKVFR